jgi:hypothetical protein
VIRAANKNQRNSVRRLLSKLIEIRMRATFAMSEANILFLLVVVGLLLTEKKYFAEIYLRFALLRIKKIKNI